MLLLFFLTSLYYTSYFGIHLFKNNIMRSQSVHRDKWPLHLMCHPLYCHYLYFSQFTIHRNCTQSHMTLYNLNQINKNKTKIMLCLSYVLSTHLCPYEPCLCPSLLQLHVLISVNKFLCDIVVQCLHMQQVTSVNLLYLCLTFLGWYSLSTLVRYSSGPEKEVQ
jgi:hypothetical protein